MYSKTWKLHTKIGIKQWVTNSKGAPISHSLHYYCFHVPCHFPYLPQLNIMQCAVVWLWIFTMKLGFKMMQMSHSDNTSLPEIIIRVEMYNTSECMTKSCLSKNCTHYIRIYWIKNAILINWCFSLPRKVYLINLECYILQYHMNNLIGKLPISLIFIFPLKVDSLYCCVPGSTRVSD